VSEPSEPIPPTEPIPAGEPDPITRRRALSRLWKAGLGLVGAAGLWTTWDLLRPVPTSGFGGNVRAIPPEDVPSDNVVSIGAARSYLTTVDSEVIALYWKCTHLGCRVPWCESSGQFECPCHGSVFNRAGDFLAGPAPRGLDRFATSVGDDGLVYIDTSRTLEGRPPGTETIDEPARGPSCQEAGEA
jgi:cytochrome b6-f complex iron-sulfur subunit